MGHTAPKEDPKPFPPDECRRVLMEVDIRAAGWSLAEARFVEELRLMALADQAGRGQLDGR